VSQWTWLQWFDGNGNENGGLHMSEILKTNTACRIPVGPLVDPTDGKTAETALTVTALTVELYKTPNDGGAITRSAFSPTASGGDNDMVLVTSSVAGVYDLELTAAQLNFLGGLRVVLYDVDAFLVWWKDYQVVTANVYDSIVGTDTLQADVSQWKGVAAPDLNNLSAADVNAEVVDVLLTDTIPDSYSAHGAQPTMAQALLEIRQFLQEAVVSGTTMTIRKPDGTTTAFTLTLDDASNPTSRLRGT
jgi:hypothetical protein